MNYSEEFAYNHETIKDATRAKGIMMFCEPGGKLKHPYLDPGGPYSSTLWDWDSFWTSYSLFGLAKILTPSKDTEELKRKTLEHALGSVKNFFKYQGEDGSLPILITTENTDCFDSISNPRTNMAKPVFGQFCEMLLNEGADKVEMENYLKPLDKYYTCFETRYSTKTGLYAWANDIGIGVDDDPTCWGRPAFSSASIFLNSFLYADLKAASKFATKLGNSEFAGKFSKQAEKLKSAIQEYCWDEKSGAFYSVDVQCKQNLTSCSLFKDLNINLKPFWNALQLNVLSWSSFLPIWNGIATKEQAERMVKEHLINEKRMWSNYGVRSLSKEERMYAPEVERGNPSNWLGPIWVVSNYMIWKGLSNYDLTKHADELAFNLLKLLFDDYARNGCLHEYYSPESGMGVCGKGFWSWNALACLMEVKIA
jgi:Mannosylglycerate hydrolase MGH1-like glycoside hydrolase domain